jgi:hypothetical protein
MIIAAFYPLSQTNVALSLPNDQNSPPFALAPWADIKVGLRFVLAHHAVGDYGLTIAFLAAFIGLYLSV